uniref:RRM domain-containing protein n=1 Tax=Knipowitschia caucasica TaxID=637954 RepID=A0AAV2K2C0_KNICA
MIPAVQQQSVESSCFHCTINQALLGNSQVCMLHYPRIHVVPTPATIPQPIVMNKASHVTSGDRINFLMNSVYKLIYESIYLALTDSKLLGWYLALSPLDRKIIQNNGGFHQFLRKHPLLELSKNHIYVKHITTVSRESSPQWSSNTVDSYSQHQGTFHSNHSYPTPQRMDPRLQELSKLAWQMASPYNGHTGSVEPEQVANFSLDSELEMHQQENPQSPAVGPDLPSHGGDASALILESRHDTSSNEDFYSILEADKSIVLCVSENKTCNNRTTENRSTSPMTSVYTCDAMVGTEQTMTDTAVNTEVYMVDLDYLTKEFGTMKTERDELLLKVQMQRVSSPFTRIVNDLKKLETDYNRMRGRILSGISLQDLTPLSLGHDSSVAAIIGGIQKDCVSPQQHTMNDKPVHLGGDGSLQSEITGCSKGDSSSAKRVVTRLLKDGGTDQRADRKSSESFSSEAWFDAEEDLSSDGSGEQLKADKEPGAIMTEKPKAVNAGLCVFGLPSRATEADVMMLFQKYDVSELHVSNLKELSVAVVIVESQQSAEAAVRELNGLRVKGHTLQVELIQAGRSDHQSTRSRSDPETTNIPGKSQNLLPTTSSRKKVVSVSPTAQGTFVPQHYGTMGSFDILMTELKQCHPDDSVDPDSVDQDSVDPDSVDQDSVDPDSVDQDSVDPDSVDQDSVDPDSVDRYSVDQDSVNQDSVDPDSMDPDSEGQDSVELS